MYLKKRALFLCKRAFARTQASCPGLFLYTNMFLLTAQIAVDFCCRFIDAVALFCFPLQDRKDEVYWDGLIECYKRGLVKNVVCVSVPCTALQCVAVCCSVLQCVAARFDRMFLARLRQECGVCCCIFQCAVMCGSVLQSVAVCCRALLRGLIEYHKRGLVKNVV